MPGGGGGGVTFQWHPDTGRVESGGAVSQEPTEKGTSQQQIKENVGLDSIYTQKKSIEFNLKLILN